MLRAAPLLCRGVPRANPTLPPGRVPALEGLRVAVQDSGRDGRVAVAQAGPELSALERRATQALTAASIPFRSATSATTFRIIPLRSQSLGV